MKIRAIPYSLMCTLLLFVWFSLCPYPTSLRHRYGLAQVPTPGLTPVKLASRAPRQSHMEWPNCRTIIAISGGLPN